MNETAKTLAFAGVALVLLAAASLATWLPDWRGPGAGFDDQGEPFFPAFAEAVEADPLAARVLEVVTYDEDTAQVRPFQVQFRPGFDLRLLPPADDAGALPTSGRNQIIVARIGGALRLRIFDADGGLLLDADESRLDEHAEAVAELKGLVEGLGDDPSPSRADRDRMLALLSTIAGRPLTDGEWTIPSHYDYPADAQDRMARLSAQVAGLTKGAIRSDRASDHEELGVIDPMDEAVTTLKGRGTRITLRGSPGGEPMADLILGRPVPDREGLRYVRVPGKNRVYAAEVDLDLTTRFADWIDTDLIDVSATRTRLISYDTRKVNPDERTADGAFLVRPGDPLVLARDEANAWTIEGLDPEQEVDPAKVGDLIRAVDSLRIVGVRPLPTSRNAALRSLVSKGFYPTQQAGLLSNEGSLTLASDEGIVYTLRFGEITVAAGDALSAGLGEDRDPSAEAEGEAEDGGRSAEAESRPADQTEGRYLIVSVAFDESFLPEEEADEPPADALPEDVFARAPDDPARVEAERRRAEALEQKQQERRRKVAEGEARVAALNRRFASWYFVVPGDDFRKIALDRDAFLKATDDPDADADADDSAAPPAFAPGGLDPLGGLPPGLGGPQG